MALDIKAVERKRADLDKAIKNNEPSPTILSLLTDLRKGVVPSDKLLRDTKIGVQVNRLKQHKDPAVARLASEMVSRWKQEMQKQKAGGVSSGANTPRANGNGGGGGNGNGVVGSSASPSKVASPAPNPTTTTSTVKEERRRFSGDPKNRNAKADGMAEKVKCTGDKTRDGCVTLMYNGLAFMSEELPEDVLRVSRQVELALHQHFKSDTSKPYMDKSRSLFHNLKNASNTKLRLRVYTGEITPQRFVLMTDEELKSEERKADDQKLMKENMDKAMVAQEEKSVSTALTCGKCGQMRVSYTQAQTRSADEPMTTFCSCLHCGNRWKFS